MVLGPSGGHTRGERGLFVVIATDVIVVLATVGVGFCHSTEEWASCRPAPQPVDFGHSWRDGLLVALTTDVVVACHDHGCGRLGRCLLQCGISKAAWKRS